jgi:hypothetical protein
LEPSTNSAAHPSYQFDDIYKNIFSNHRRLLEVLRMKFIHPTLGFAPWELELFGCTHELYRPLCAFIGLLVNSSFPEGDSPLDFLFDFQRAGPLYEDSHYTAKVAVIRWMHTVKTLINGQDQGQGVYWDIWDL